MTCPQRKCDNPACGKAFTPKTARSRQRYCQPKCNWTARSRGVQRASRARASGNPLNRPLLWATAEEERARREKKALQLIDEGVGLGAIKERMGFDVSHLVSSHGRRSVGAYYQLPYGPPAR